LMSAGAMASAPEQDHADAPAPEAAPSTSLAVGEMGVDVGILGGGGLDSIASSNMAPFLTKLFQIVSATATDRCITWTARGDSFVISDPDSFARDILPTYFKHNNIRSFVRQLNTYGFRKRTNISSTDEHLEFFHEKFKRDQPALLMQIKRCHQPKPHARGAHEGMMNEAGASKGGAAGAPDMDSIKNRVGELKNRLGSLQAEIRDYNSQMEHKVNLLMQILQSSAPSTNPMVQPPMITPQQRTPHGMHPPAAAPYLRAPSGLGMMPGGGAASMDLLNRRDDLFKHFGGQTGPIGGLGGGMANLGGLGSSLGLGGLSGMNAASLMGLHGMQKPGEVAGLQHLLEAAQRTQTDESSLLPHQLLEAAQRNQADDAAGRSRELASTRS